MDDLLLKEIFDINYLLINKCCNYYYDVLDDKNKILINDIKKVHYSILNNLINLLEDCNE